MLSLHQSPNQLNGTLEQKNGEPVRAPRRGVGFPSSSLLESDTEAELQLTHANGGTRGGIGLDVRDLASLAAAIYATVGQGQHGVVEEVVSIEAELCFDALRDDEVLRQRHVVVEGMRTPVGINSYVTNLSASGKNERTGDRPSERAGVHTNIGWRNLAAIRKRGNWGEPVGSTVLMTEPSRKRARAFVGTAWTGVLERAALVDTGSPRKTGAVGQGVGHLPATKCQVCDTASITHEHFALAYGQLVDHVGHKHLIAVVLVWTPSNLLVYGAIIAVVCVGAGEGGVREELETVARALFDLHLQSVVFVVGVVAVVVGIHCAASGCGMHVALRVRESKSRIGECGHAVPEERAASRCRHTPYPRKVSQSARQHSHTT